MTVDAAPKPQDQYSLTQILGLWAAAPLPMALLGWVVYPRVAPDWKSDPLGAGVTRVLFGFYHLYQPWGILGSIVAGVLLFALPAHRFRSTWMAVIVHSGQSVFFAFLILGIVLGLA
jgi:hypothetical protein